MDVVRCLCLLTLMVPAWVEAAPRALTLAEALAAVATAPELAGNAATVRAATAEVDAAGAWPATSLQVATTRATARVVVGASFPLPVFGTLSAARDRARAELEVTRVEASGAEWDLRWRVAAAWIELARAEARAGLLAAVAEREASLAGLADKRFRAGDSPRLEALSAQVEARRAEAEARSAALDATAAAATLAGLLGLDPAAELTAAPGLPAAPAPEALPPMASWLAHADAHPEVRAAEARAHLTDTQKDEADAAGWPGLALEAEASIDDATLPGTDLRGGVALEIPLFAHHGAAVEAAQARQAAARSALDAAQRTRRAEIVAAWRRLDAAATSAQVLTTDVRPAADEAAALARKAYQAGATTLVSVLEAERALADAQLAQLEAQAAAALAQADLEHATGSLP